MKKTFRSLQMIAKGYSAVEVKVLEATNDDPYWPSDSAMAEIARITFNNSTDFYQVMDMIDKVLNSSKKVLTSNSKAWISILKAIVLLDHCIHLGSELCVTWSRKNIYILKTLRNFEYTDREGRDVGQNVRRAADDICKLVMDEERLRAERANKDSWTGRRTYSDMGSIAVIQDRPMPTNASLLNTDYSLSVTTDYSAGRQDANNQQTNSSSKLVENLTPAELELDAKLDPYRSRPRYPYVSQSQFHRPSEDLYSLPQLSTPPVYRGIQSAPQPSTPPAEYGGNINRYSDDARVSGHASPSGLLAESDTIAKVFQAHDPGGNGMLETFEQLGLHERGGSGAAGGELTSNNLEFLRNNPQFQQLRQVVQREPQMLEPILQQIGAGNPQLAQLIASNPEQFLQLLAEDADEDAPSPPRTISVTEGEREAIERLCRLGFERDLVIQAYFACDKNEELAVQLLSEDADKNVPLASGSRKFASMPAAIRHSQEMHSSDSNESVGMSGGFLQYKLLDKNPFKVHRKYFWLSVEPLKPGRPIKVGGEKTESWLRAVAWSSYTGTGLLFMADGPDKKEYPEGIIALAYAGYPVKEGPDMLSLSVDSSRYQFQAENSILRDRWATAIEQAITNGRNMRSRVESSRDFIQTKALFESYLDGIGRDSGPRALQQLDEGTGSDRASPHLQIARKPTVPARKPPSGHMDPNLVFDPSTRTFTRKETAMAIHSELNEEAEQQPHASSSAVTPSISSLAAGRDYQQYDPAAHQRTMSHQDPGLTAKREQINSPPSEKPKTSRDNKRRTVQVEYVAPQSQTVRGEASPTGEPVGASASRSNNQGHAPISEVIQAAPSPKPSLLGYSRDQTSPLSSSRPTPMSSQSQQILSSRLNTYFDSGDSARNNYTDADIQEISSILKHQTPRWSKVPRTYVVLRVIGHLDLLDDCIDVGFSDYWFPVTERSLPDILRQSIRTAFVDAQQLVMTQSMSLEKGDKGEHCYFRKGDTLPLETRGVLGRGGFGQVDRVLSLISFKEYARKRVLRSAAFRGRKKEDIKQFIAEIEILKRLKHRHVVEFVGSYTDAKYIGLIISPIADCDLASYLSNATPSTYPELRTFFDCLATALEFLHEHNVRHKDIKPQNILVSNGTVLFADFGLSFDFTDATGSTTMSMVNGMTPRYCAPEVANHQSRNTASDIWCLGVVYLEMIVTLKGENLQYMDGFLRQRGSEQAFIRLNAAALPELVTQLATLGQWADNKALDWTVAMLDVLQSARPTASALVNMITAPIREGDNTGFCGICCALMEEEDFSDYASD